MIIARKEDVFIRLSKAVCKQIFTVCPFKLKIMSTFVDSYRIKTLTEHI